MPPPAPSCLASVSAGPNPAALDLTDYDADNGTLRVIGKRDRERTAYVVKGGRADLDYWLKFRSDDPGPLVVPVSKSGTSRGTPTPR